MKPHWTALNVRIGGRRVDRAACRDDGGQCATAAPERKRGSVPGSAITLFWIAASGLGFWLAGQTTSRAARASSSILREVADIPLPGGASRFDYQSLDPRTGRLYISHMGDGHVVVFDIKTRRVVANLPGFPRVTGVLAVPQLGHVYASATGNHQVAVIDEKTLRTMARIPGIRFPDGIAYDPIDQKVFVSDESGQADMAIDARANRRVAMIPMGGEVGNTQYDPASHLIFANVQTRNDLVAIDPRTDRIAGRYHLSGGRYPHGLYIDAPHRLAFAACQGDARLLVIDMHTMRVTAVQPIGRDPDVLAFDPALQRLYVACESGVVSVLDERLGTLVKREDVMVAPEAHTVSVDPQTHLVYLPLQNVGGRPVLRIMAPALP
jgi:DNA-binding beta-propeller fold protein YncE